MEEYQIEWYKRIGDKFTDILGSCRNSNYSKLELLSNVLENNEYYVNFWKICPYCHKIYSFHQRECSCQSISYIFI